MLVTCWLQLASKRLLLVDTPMELNVKLCKEGFVDPSLYQKLVGSFVYTKSFPSWVVFDARIMSWLLGSVEPHIVTNLQAHRIAQGMWNYVKTVYHQVNDARRFQLENEISIFQHGNLSIQDYYSTFLTLWQEYTNLFTADVSSTALSTIKNLHTNSRRDQCLMKLRPEFESVQSSY